MVSSLGAKVKRSSYGPSQHDGYSLATLDIRCWLLGVKNMKNNEDLLDDAINEVGRRLAAAYVSYIAGHVGVDRMLKQTPERAGAFWHDLADLLFRVIATQGPDDPESRLRLGEVITKYVQ
jgi:hypothetical protein